MDLRIFVGFGAFDHCFGAYLQLRLATRAYYYYYYYYRLGSRLVTLGNTKPTKPQNLNSSKHAASETTHH